MKLTSGVLLCVIAVTLVLGCSEAPTAKLGDRVRVSFVGRLESGEVFDSTNTGQSIDFVIGAHQVIQGFENSVIGMRVGESKTALLPPDQAYGPYSQELTHIYDIDSFPPNIVPEVGMVLSMTATDGRVLPIRVVSIDSSGHVAVDGNHELAGKTITLDLKLLEIMEDNSQK